MIDVYIYCSMGNSGAGYQMASADRTARKMIPYEESPVPQKIADFWTHAGALAYAGNDGKRFFLAVKKIRLPLKDEHSRTVYAYAAFACGLDEEKNIENFTRGFFARYNDAEAAMGKIILPSDNDIGYTLNFDKLQKLIDSCIAVGEKVSGTKNDLFKIKFSKRIPVSFAATESNYKYFAAQCGLPAHACHAKIVTAEEYTKKIEN